MKWTDIPKKRLFVVAMLIVSLFAMVTMSGCSASRTIHSLNSLKRSASRLNETNDKAEENKSDSLSSAMKILKAHNINFTVLAASKQNTNGFLAVVQNEEKYYIGIYSAKDNKIAWTDYTAKTVNFKDNYSIFSNGTKSYRPLIFIMDIPNDNKESQDAKEGIWNDTHHHIPVYALFKVDDKGEVIPDGKLFTGGGLKPGHYHGTIYDQQNINLAHVLLTHMDSLKNDIKARNVIAPG